MSISRWMDNGQSLNSPVFYFAWSSLMLKHFSGICLSLIIIFSSMICFVLFNIYLCSISPFVHALCSWPQWAPFWKLFSILFQVYISDYYFSLEKEMATHSSILAWRIPWTEKPGGLQSMVSKSRTRLSDWTELDRSKEYHTEWSKSERDKQILYINTYIWNQHCLFTSGCIHKLLTTSCCYFIPQTVRFGSYV